jgi:tyrosyl-tRNA synthetase
MQYQQTDIVSLLVDTAMAASKSEARRLVTQGGVSIDAVKVTDPYASVDITEQRILRVGKLRFLRIIGQ